MWSYARRPEEVPPRGAGSGCNSGSGERGAVPSDGGSDLGVDGLPHPPKQIADDHIDEPQEFVQRRDGHVLNLTDDLEETLDLRGGAEGDPQVSPKLQRGAERVSFYDIGLDRQRRTPELIEHRTRPRMVGAIRGSENCNRQSMSTLPDDERTILAHGRNLYAARHSR